MSDKYGGGIMKRILIIVAVVAMAASISYGQTQVLSRNAVGYVRLTAATGTFNFVSHNFVNIDGAAITVTNLLGDQVPAGSIVYLWNEATQGYISESRAPFGWTPGTNIIERGRGFWLKMADSAASNQYQIYLMGEVPDATNSDNAVIGFNMVGYPYPVETYWTNTDLAKNAAVGDIVYFWTGSGYGSASLSPIGWIPATNMVTPGMGFWFKSSAAVAWDETKPYTWP